MGVDETCFSNLSWFTIGTTGARHSSCWIAVLHEPAANPRDFHVVEHHVRLDAVSDERHLESVPLENIQNNKNEVKLTNKDKFSTPFCRASVLMTVEF